MEVFARCYQLKTIRSALLLGLIGIAALVFPQALAGGGYTSPGSRALADSNSSGDILLAGDTKILLKRNNYEHALQVKSSTPGEPEVVTGALQERSSLNSIDGDATHAVVCIGTHIYFLSIDSSGRGRTDQRQLQTDLNLKRPRELRCAVNAVSGDWMAINLNSGDAILNGSEKLSLAAPSERWTHAFSLMNSFFVVGENGLARRITPSGIQGTPASLASVKAPWPDLQNRDSLFARGQSLLRSGESQTAIVNFVQDSNLRLWSAPQRIPISPCSEVGGCGAWLAPDGRWIVGGSWGIYIGRGTSFSRIKAPLLTSDATSPGVALVPASNKYIHIGDIDTDIAALPAEAHMNRFVEIERLNESSEFRAQRKRRALVWLKGKQADFAKGVSSSRETHPVLFAYSAHSNSQKFSGEVVIHEGPLPERWPESWAAVEQEIEFNELKLANEWIPVASETQGPPAQSAWWVDAAGFRAALDVIHKNNIPLQQIKVAVIDSGIDLEHPAFKNILDISAAELPDNGIDDDENGLTDDLIGYDFVREQPNPVDDFGHGTHVAALLNNAWSGQSLLGGAFNTKLRIFRALDRNGKSNSIDLSRAISAAIKSRTDIMNCSWGGGPETQALRDAFAAARSSGMMIFSSAGNDGLHSDKAPPVPKNFPGVLAIGASTERGSRARFSNWGERSVFAFAPGTDITSALPGAQYGEKSGTSMASPIAAAAGALMLGAVRASHPEWSREQQNQNVEALLCSGSQKAKPSPDASRCGSINAFKSFERFREGMR